MQKSLILLVVFATVFSYVGAASAWIIPLSPTGQEHGQGPEHSKVIKRTESGEWDLVRYDFIHYAKPDRPGKPDKPGGKPPKEASCFDLMGVKWKTLPVDYTINPTNDDGLPEWFVVSMIATSAATWDSATAENLFTSIPTVDYGAQYGIQDYENAIVFDDYQEDGVIGVTSIWYTRRGKQIVEFDMILDTDYTWGDATFNPNVMDLANIVTHELGHAVGLGDVYQDQCEDVSMYGYSDNGDTKKRTLEPADITGLLEMY